MEFSICRGGGGFWDTYIFFPCDPPPLNKPPIPRIEIFLRIFGLLRGKHYGFLESYSKVMEGFWRFYVVVRSVHESFVSLNESQWVTRAGDWVSSHTSSRCRVLFWCFTRQTQSQKSKLRIYTIFNVSKEENQEFWKKLAKVFKFFNKDQEFLVFPKLFFVWVLSHLEVEQFEFEEWCLCKRVEYCAYPGFWLLTSFWYVKRVKSIWDAGRKNHSDGNMLLQFSDEYLSCASK